MSSKNKTAELEVQTVSLDKILPHPKNPRIHCDPGTDEWNALKRSLNNDYFDPLVWNRKNGFLVSGHLRRKVLEAEGFTHAVVVVKEYDEKTHIAKMIAANRQQGADDITGLGNILSELREQDFKPEMEISGLSELEIAEYIDLSFLAGESADKERKGREEGDEKFTLTIPMDSKNHSFVSDVINRAKSKLKLATMEDVTVAVFKHFEKTILKK